MMKRIFLAITFLALLPFSTANAAAAAGKQTYRYHLVNNTSKQLATDTWLDYKIQNINAKGAVISVTPKGKDSIAQFYVKYVSEKGYITNSYKKICIVTLTNFRTVGLPQYSIQHLGSKYQCHLNRNRLIIDKK